MINKEKILGMIAVAIAYSLLFYGIPLTLLYHNLFLWDNFLLKYFIITTIGLFIIEIILLNHTQKKEENEQ